PAPRACPDPTRPPAPAAPPGAPGAGPPLRHERPYGQAHRPGAAEVPAGLLEGAALGPGRAELAPGLQVRLHGCRPGGGCGIVGEHGIDEYFERHGQLLLLNCPPYCSDTPAAAIEIPQ